MALAMRHDKRSIEKHLLALCMGHFLATQLLTALPSSLWKPSRFSKYRASCSTGNGDDENIYLSADVHLVALTQREVQSTVEDHERLYSCSVGDTLQRIRELVRAGDVKRSAHGYDELVVDGISTREKVEGVQDSLLIEEYPSFGKGPCVLVRQQDRHGAAIHAVWGIPKNSSSPAVRVTAYRPDPECWVDEYTRRK